MENRRVVSIWISAILFALSESADILWLVDLFERELSGSSILSMIFLIAAIAFSVIYCLKNYQKNAATYYKTGFALFLIANAICVYVTITERFYLGTACSVIVVVSLLIITFTKDLGKVRTFVLAFAILFCSVVEFLAKLLRFGYDNSLFIIAVISALIILIMVYTKYEDKEARYTTKA